MKRRDDLILIHAPSIYDFRKLPIMHGPISDVVPSTPIFEMYPIGFASLSEYLERKGFQVRIINVALKMIKNPDFDAEALIRKLDPLAFGFDLHWMPHVQGSLALAEIVKKYHPDTPVLFGGLSSTYFHEDLITNYPFIDYVVRGDSTEEPMARLLGAIRAGTPPVQIPNITWRDNGNIRVNPLSYVPDTMNHISIDYGHIMKKVVKYRDMTGYVPFTNWLEYPVTAVFTCRGCSYNCRTCGGSAYGFARYANRKRPAYRDPELLAEDIFRVCDHLKAPVMIIGDIYQAGEDYGETLLRKLKTRRIPNHVAFEFFKPPRRDQIAMIADSVENFNFEISPESHDEKVRHAFGRYYNNEELERMIADALELGCKRFDLFFMTGLPHQTTQSVLDTVEYSRTLLERFGETKRLYPFISPLAPFLDPGSEVFENPEKFGYKFFYRTVEEHRRAMLSPSWQYILNYETQWMTRSEIVYSTYEAGLRMNRLKKEYGLIDARIADETDKRIQEAVAMMRKIDALVAEDRENKGTGTLYELKDKMASLNISTVCFKKELEWPTHFLRMNFLKIMKTVLLPNKPNILPEGKG